MEYFKEIIIAIGKKIIEKALHLYFILKKDNVPIKIKFIIVISLIYIFSPIDILPDFIPILGWIDDFIVLMVLLNTVLKYITEDIKNKASNKLEEWFN
jgi:uncharacterized membrane protein YkvA (DUF1232 family)